MSNSHFIKQLFKIEDENLTIIQRLVEEGRNGVRAHLIIDRFHSVQQLTQAMNHVRIKNMNAFNQNKNEEAKDYRKLKNTGVCF